MRMWMIDLAREQSPSLDVLYQYASHALDSGFDSLGLYLEHRFAYPSAPWVAGKGAVTPSMVESLQSEFPSLQIVPFINLLGHMEGFIYTEEGKRYREQLFQGMQACPSKPEFVEFCRNIIDDTVKIFKSDLIHIGGDETWQLGACDQCKAVVEGVPEGEDGKAKLYGDHFGPLAERVKEHGRRPGLWGDMFLTHPTALDRIPKDALIFDWQYFNGVEETSKTFTERGFEVVGASTLHVYNATWLHIEKSEENVRAIVDDGNKLGLKGSCLTTWECGLFGAFDTLLPAIKASGRIAKGEDTTILDEYKALSRDHGRWAEFMGIELEEIGKPFTFIGIRSSLKARFLLYGNPFLAWMHLHEDLAGETGEKALAIFEKAMQAAPGEAEKGVTIFARGAVEFVRLADEAAKLYAQRKPEAAVAKLASTRMIFDDLEKVAQKSYERIGGSLADIERCRTCKQHVETVIKRIRDYGNDELGYLPAFEVITNHKFMPHDQANWWLINRWANE